MFGCDTPIPILSTFPESHAPCALPNHEGAKYTVTCGLSRSLARQRIESGHQTLERRDFESTLHLVRGAQDGQRDAMEELFARYLPRVRTIVALRMGFRLRQLADVEDLVQESLLKIFQGLDRFEQRSEGTFRNWLSHCVEYEIAGFARKVSAKKRGGGNARRFGDYDSRFLLSTSILASAEPDPADVAGARELEEQIEEALLAMPVHYREVILLRQLCELSYAEVAEALGLKSEDAARQACSRALRKLKATLDS